MDDNQKKSSWDDLLQDLGAQPDESAFERHQPPSQEIPAEADVAPVAQQPTSDWSSLAGSLGLEAEGPVEGATEPVAQTPSAVEAEAREEPSAAAEVQPVAEPFGGAPTDPAAEAEFATEEKADEAIVAEQPTETGAELVEEELPPLPSRVDEVLIERAWDDDQEEDEHTAANESTTSSLADPSSAGKESETGMTGEAARSAFDALFADGASGWGSAFLDKPKPVDEQGALSDPWGDELVKAQPDSEDGADGDETSRSDEESEEGERPKRKRSRRRRRGGRGRKPASGERLEGGEVEEGSQENAEEQSSAGASAEDDSPTEGKEKKRRPRRSRSRGRSRSRDDEKQEVTSDSADQDDFDQDEFAEGGQGSSDAQEDDGAPRGRRQRHRNLPTWGEAIGMIVDANLEQRAKSPSKPQSSRGGRGRGGRRRGGRKQQEDK